MEKDEQSATSRRVSLLFLMIFLILAVLIFRLSFLQLSQGDQFLALADNNRYITQSIPAPRGLIYDRNGQILVRNKPAFTITFQKLGDDMQSPAQLAAVLSPILNMRPEDIYKSMDPQGQKYSLAVARKIVTNATPQEVAYVREHKNELPGLNVITEPIRDYLYGNLASHVLGYLNDIPQSFWQQHQGEYQQTDKIGMAGVEKQYESVLHGKDGQLKVEVNINYQPLQEKQTQDPVRGDDLYLTIDRHLQQATQQALAQKVQTLHRRVRTMVNGAAIAMNPKTGEILAMASYPYYDPNMWIKGVNQQEYNNFFMPAEMNRAIQQTYLPGSVVKMSTVLIGLHEHAITPYTVFNDPGSIDFGNTRIRSWTTSIGPVNSFGALAQSSNVYMIHVFENLFGYNDRMTNAQVREFLQKTLPQKMKTVLNYHKTLGLGEQKTGVDLPYEEPGRVTQEGNASDLAFTAFGQSEEYTLMQLAVYNSTLANNGKRMKPYVVKSIKHPDGTEQITQPTVVNQAPFTPSEIKAVQQGMHDVIHTKKGTFSTVFPNYPYKIAGKTGTAETGRGTENDVFVGYAPYDDPQIAIAIMLPDNELNSHSYNTLGPVAKAMFDAYFKLDQKKQGQVKEIFKTSRISN